MEKLRNRVDVKLVINKKDYLKWTSKPGYMKQKIFDNILVAIRKNKVTLTLNKNSTFWFKCTNTHYDYIKNKYGKNSRLLVIYTDSFMNEIKTVDVYDD